MKIIYYLFLCFLLYSCNSQPPKEKLTIIDDLVLGDTKEDFAHQLERLKIPHRTFFTKWMCLNEQDAISNIIDLHYTNLFNFSEYIDKPNSIEHLGLFYPTSRNNQNITGLIILLGHTSIPAVPDILKDTTKILFFRQDVNKDIMEKIKDMYKVKYGKPEYYIDTTAIKTFYRLNEKTIIDGTCTDINAYKLIWATDYFTISFFSGCDLGAYYVSSGRKYSESSNKLYSNPSPQPIDPTLNPMQCFSVPYIKYELTDKAIKELKLDKLNL